MSGDVGLREIKANILRTILARRITLGVFTAVALVVILTSQISYLNPLFYAPLAWFLITFPFQFLISRQNDERTLHWVHAAFFIVEIAIITLLIHLMGGSEWIGIMFYLFTVIYANFFLPRLQGYLITVLAVLLYALLVMLEYAGWIPHNSLFAVLGEPYRSLSYTLTTLLAGGIGIYATLAFTVREFSEIYARKNRALARLSKQLLSAQEEERRRLAHQLHDRLGQSLAAVKLHLATLRRRHPEAEVGDVVELLNQAIEETRTLAYSLRPPLLDDLGLVPSLRRLTDMTAEASDLEVHADLRLSGRPPPPIESLLFGAAQEAMANVRAHARAKRLTVTLRRAPAGVVLTVEDDGIGFRPNDPQGLGLQGIRERVEVAGGVMTIRSRPGRGSHVTVEVPDEATADPDR
jgi:signal transduction histidine kinase